MEKRLAEIRNQIALCKKPGQDVLLIAVSKNCSIAQIEEAYNLGLRDFGENKVQELLEKIDNISAPINWHFIGHLQTNKVKYIVGRVCLIHSVDSIKLLREIDKEAMKKNIIVDVLLEVNVSLEESKYGFRVEELDSALHVAETLSFVRVKGLMTMAPHSANEDCLKLIFTSLHEKFIDINDQKLDNIEMTVLSMGMSRDYKEAILCGSNCVRIGTYIFKG